MNLARRFITTLKPLVERFPALATMYRRGRDQYLRKKYAPTVAQTPLGYSFVGERAEMYTCTWEPEEVALFNRLLDDVDMLINVGANAGYYCCMALNKGKQVVAFEPMESNLHYLYQNIYLNGWSDQCEVLPVALGNTNGLLELYGFGMIASSIRGWAGNKDPTPHLVPVFQYDRLIGQRFAGRRCMVLVDIEGAEYQFLQGASALLCQTPKPVWLMEVQSSAWQPAGVKVNPYYLDTFRLFWQASYEAYTADSESRKLDEQALASNAAVIEPGKQVTNFVFIEKDRSFSL